ncbi:MAG: hypothetical protein JWM53_2512 [bacterium]|nr:hypothetical protein [bacterium]
MTAGLPAVGVVMLLGLVGCGNSGQLVADSGAHAGIVAASGYIVWLRCNEPDTNSVGAINLLPVGSSHVATLVPGDALQSRFRPSLGDSFAIRGDQVYFVGSSGIDSVSVGAPGQITPAFMPGGSAVVANVDHVFWSQWTSIVSHSLIDGTEGIIPTADYHNDHPVDDMAADDSQLYFLDHGALKAAPASGGAATLLASDVVSQINVAGGFVYWLGTYGVFKTATTGGSAIAVATEQDFIDHYTIDDRFVYWTSVHNPCGANADNCTTTYHVRRQPLAGGSSTTLATLDLAAESMAADGGHLYVLTASGVYIF